MNKDPQPPDGRAILPAGPQAVSAYTDDLLSEATRTLCFCHSVPVAEVLDCLRESPTTRVADVGSKCRAGTGCGSCRLVIGELIRRQKGSEPDFTDS